MTQYNGGDLLEALEALVAEPDNMDELPDDWEQPYEGYISELLYHMESEAVVTPLGLFKVVDTWRHNDEQGVVIKDMDTGRLFRVQAYYSSYGDSGDEWYDPEITEVKSVTKTVTRYQSLSSSVIFEHPSEDVE